MTTIVSADSHQRFLETKRWQYERRMHEYRGAQGAKGVGCGGGVGRGCPPPHTFPHPFPTGGRVRRGTQKFVIFGAQNR